MLGRFLSVNTSHRNFAVKNGRIIHLQQGIDSRSFVNLSGYPPLLAACKESRLVAKKIYILGFDRKLVRKAPMYFTPTDTLFFEGINDLKRFITLDSKAVGLLPLNNSSIKSIALGGFSAFSQKNPKFQQIANEYGYSGSFEYLTDYTKKLNVPAYLCRFTGLEELILLYDSDYKVESGGFWYPKDQGFKNLATNLEYFLKTRFHPNLTEWSARMIKHINDFQWKQRKCESYYGYALPVTPSKVSKYQSSFLSCGSVPSSQSR